MHGEPGRVFFNLYSVLGIIVSVFVMESNNQRRNGLVNAHLTIGLV